MAAISFASAVALASSIALGGCFGIFLPLAEDSCEIASSYLRACLGAEPPGGPIVEECTNENLCVGRCINAASCDELKDAFGATSGPQPNPFLDCTAMCFDGSSPPPPSPGGEAQAKRPSADR